MSALSPHDKRLAAFHARRRAEKRARAQVEAWQRAIRCYWRRRPCFICHALRWCSHREPAIAEAEAYAAGFHAS